MLERCSSVKEHIENILFASVKIFSKGAVKITNKLMGLHTKEGRNKTPSN